MDTQALNRQIYVKTDRKGVYYVDEEDYEILPHKELEELRHEVEELKKNPMGNVEKSQDLISEMAKLTKAVHLLIDILTHTNDEMVEEFKRTSISEHFKLISDQNERIANAILSLANAPDNTSAQANQSPDLQQTEQDNIPGLMNTQAPTDTNFAMPKETASPQANNFPLPQATTEATIPSQSQANSPTSEMPPLDLPPPEHKKKGMLSGIFK